MNDRITVHEAAYMLNDSGRCLADFLQVHEPDHRDEVSKRDVEQFILTTKAIQEWVGKRIGKD